MKYKWECPMCGSGDMSHGHGECRNLKGNEQCHGFQCLCDFDSTDKHGISSTDPCHHARCFHCDWEGTYPKPETMNIGKIYDKLHKALPLTDEELKFAVDTLRPVERVLRALGPHFFLAASRIAYDLDDMIGFIEARKEKR